MCIAVNMSLLGEGKNAPVRKLVRQICCGAVMCTAEKVSQYI